MPRPSPDVSCGTASIAREGNLPKRSEGQNFATDRMGNGSCVARNDSRNEWFSEKETTMRVSG